MPTTYSLDAYRRHAERFGAECVFETAVGDLSVVDLGRLSIRMQKLDPRWRVPADRAQFAGDLIDAGEPLDRACRMAMISRTTLWREKVLGDRGQVADQASKAPISQGATVAKQPSPTETLPTPVLQHLGAQNGSQRVAAIAGQMSIFEVEGVA
jgi:hypothetical protein